MSNVTYIYLISIYLYSHTKKKQRSYLLNKTFIETFTGNFPILLLLYRLTFLMYTDLINVKAFIISTYKHNHTVHIIIIMDVVIHIIALVMSSIPLYNDPYYCSYCCQKYITKQNISMTAKYKSIHIYHTYTYRHIVTQ